MCGICGVLDRFGKSSKDQIYTDVKTMIRSMRHRGPDASGIYQDKGIALGATRLSVIDLSEAANQPMSDENEEYTLVFNGEIYNYLELRSQLKKRGVVFRTKSDTEVLLQLFKEKGVACLDDLRGMFAFAIFRKSTRTLFLARDKIGEKPLVYYMRDGLFIFASEIRSIVSLAKTDRTIDPVGIHLGFYYVLPPAPYSAFKYIRKLPPGTCLTISKDKVVQKRYFVLNVPPAKTYSADEAIENLRDKLDDTVRLLCRSDVSVGATLSGGMDSSSVVSSMARVFESFDTFFIGREGLGLDKERFAARMVSKQYGMKLHETYIGPEIIEHVHEVVKSYAEPFTSFVPLHAHILAKSIRGKSTVILSGNGGDEIFGGYPEHQTFLKYTKKLELWSRLRRMGLDQAVKFMPLKAVKASQKKYDELSRIPLPLLSAHIRFRPLKKILSSLYSRQMAVATAHVDPGHIMADAFQTCGASDILNGYMCQQLLASSQHGIVTIPDMSGMHHSLEFRSPFLDIEMISLAAELPWPLKIKRKYGDSGGKWIFRQAMKDRLPVQVTSLDKSGFGSFIPYPEWFLGKWRPFVKQRLLSKALRESEFFELSKVWEAMDMASKGHNTPLEPLWGIVTLSLWLEEFG